MGGKLLPNMNFTNTQLNTQYILPFNGKYQIPQKPYLFLCIYIHYNTKTSLKSHYVNA